LKTKIQEEKINLGPQLFEPFVKQFRLKGKKITFSQHNLVSMTYSAVIYSVCIYSRSLLEQSLLLITTETNNKMSQSELEGKNTSNWCQALENAACEQVAIGFGLTLDWLRKWRKQ